MSAYRFFTISISRKSHNAKSAEYTSLFSIRIEIIWYRKLMSIIRPENQYNLIVTKNYIYDRSITEL